jgi:uncharacterized membrane protein YeaQ/YmgE (transglycosylase-associated protein family)
MEIALFLTAILVGGLTLGSAARLLVPGTQRFSLSTTTLVGIAGAAIGSALVNLVDPGASLTETGLATAIGALIGSVIVLGVLVLITRRFGTDPPPQQPTAVELLEAGESADVEFKSTARTNLHTGKRDDAIELAVAKTVAGFLNAAGGALVIGVDDDGVPLGLDEDLGLMKQPDHDRYELWLNDYLESTLGKPSLAFISTGFERVSDADVVIVHVRPADAPVFLNEPGGHRTADFYVRMGNSTRKLLTDEFARYRPSRWK